MDAWIVALRGGSEALVEGRALFGPPIAAVERTELHAFETHDPAVAARLLLAAAAALGDGTGAAGIEDPGDPTASREAVVAAALAGAPGEFLVCASAREALAAHVVYVRPRRRARWRIPVPALALAPDLAARSVCIAAAATLPARPPLVDRETEIDALRAAIAPGAIVVLRAASGLGGSRVLAEAASRARAVLIRLSPSALADDDAFDRALRAVPVEGAAWLALDPLPPGASLALPRARFDSLLSRAHGASLVVRVDPGDLLPWSDPDTEVEVGPLAPSDARALVRALLGVAEDSVVARLARRGGGVPRALVDAARLAVQRGEVVRDPSDGTWRWRSRRVVRPRGAAHGPTAARLAALSPVEARSLQGALYIGEGVDHQALGTLLRALFGPPDAVEALGAHGLLDVEDGRVTFSAALPGVVPADEALVARIERLRSRGVTELLVAAANAPPAEAARALALAARRALAAQDPGAAVRLGAAAVQRAAGPYTAEVDRVRAEVAAAVGAAVILGIREAVEAPARRMDPASIERTVDALAARGDDTGAVRLRALAALARGDTEPALRLANAPGTLRDHLVVALARARAGQGATSARHGLAALALARHAGDLAGEAAALAVLGVLYAALGRDAEAAALTAASRALSVRATDRARPPGSRG